MIYPIYNFEIGYYSGLPDICYMSSLYNLKYRQLLGIYVLFKSIKYFVQWQMSLLYNIQLLYFHIENYIFIFSR